MIAGPVVPLLFAFLAMPAAIGAQRIDLVRVDKSDRELSLIRKGTVVARFRVALGGNPVGAKGREGDGRTPEGRYVLDYKKRDSAFFWAIHVSYPNRADAERARLAGVRPGGAIMVHGQKNGFAWASGLSRRFDWTNGCIALSNADMQAVWDLVQVPTTVEIVP